MNRRGPILKVKTKLQSQLIWMIFAALAIPVMVFGGALCFMIAKLSVPNGGVSPQEVIIDVIGYVAFLFPLLVAALLFWVFHGTNKLVGPIERMIREMDQRIEGQKSGPIILRPGDQLIPLVDRINALLEERDKLKERSVSHLPLRGPHMLDGPASVVAGIELPASGSESLP